MSSSESNIVEIVEPEAELWADQRVGRWVHFSSDAVGLEAEDARSNIIHVIPPSGNDRISIDLSAWDSSSS